MYDYESHKWQLETPAGREALAKVRTFVSEQLRSAGAVRMDKISAIQGPHGVWTLLACTDHMLELGELILVPGTALPLPLHLRIFVEGPVAISPKENQ